MRRENSMGRGEEMAMYVADLRIVYNVAKVEGLVRDHEIWEFEMPGEF